MTPVESLSHALYVFTINCEFSEFPCSQFLKMTNGGSVLGCSVAMGSGFATDESAAAEGWFSALLLHDTINSPGSRQNTNRLNMLMDLW